ncbi:MAG: hypothetical protein OXU94_07455, partial [Gammaproteobacteria bacterium]|nr:hypothetical protein [Gammaproteobacteria bacterium]
DAESFTLNITSAGLPTGTHIGPALTIAVTDDDPAARAARVKTPLATFAKSATQLTAQAVSRRIHFDGTNTFNVSPAKDLLHQSAFSLAHANGGMNLWATGGRLSASGDHSGTNYNGDTDAIHIGVDTEWNNGLLGIAISQASGETNFTHDGIRSTLESDLASVHPYLTRTLTDVQLWATAGIGDGEARLREGGSVDTGLSLLSAAAGVVYAPRPNASFHVAGQWSRAELDAATFTDGRELPKVTAAAARLAGGVELSQAFGDWRPFFTVSLRRDSGDGDTGDAADYGGGVEWQNRAVHLRLAGRKHAQGKGPNEENLTLTARKTAGRLNLGLNLTAASGLNTADLLSGELRF